MRHPVVVVGAEDPAVHGAGRISSPSAVSVTSPPSALARWRARRAGRSRGRGCARSRAASTGASASAASAATTGVSSPTSCRSRSTPCERAGAAHGQPVVGRGRPRRPCGEDLAQRGRRPGWSRAASRGTVTAPPVTTAAARNGAALDRSGSIVDVDGARSGRGRPPSGRLGVVDLDAALAQHRDRHVDVGQRGHRLAVVADVDALVVPGAGEQQRRDELAGRRGVDDDLAAARPRRCRATVNGSVPRPSSSTVDAEGAQGVEDRGHRPGARVRVAVEARPRPSASAATGGTKRITVPASPQSTVAGPAQRARGDRPVVARGVDVGAEARSAAAISSVSRERSARRTTRGPVGERGEHERPVGERLGAGQRHRGPHRARRRTAPARGRRVGARVHAASLPHAVAVRAPPRGSPERQPKRRRDGRAPGCCRPGGVHDARGSRRGPSRSHAEQPGSRPRSASKTPLYVATVGPADDLAAAA